MTNPMLKTKAGGLLDKKFARLLQPTEDVRSNEELYEAVHRHGKAVIIKVELFSPVGEPIEMTPEQFEQEWQGD